MNILTVVIKKSEFIANRLGIHDFGVIPEINYIDSPHETKPFKQAIMFIKTDLFESKRNHCNDW